MIAPCGRRSTVTCVLAFRIELRLELVTLGDDSLHDGSDGRVLNAHQVLVTCQRLSPFGRRRPGVGRPGFDEHSVFGGLGIVRRGHNL